MEDVVVARSHVARKDAKEWVYVSLKYENGKTPEVIEIRGERYVRANE